MVFSWKNAWRTRRHQILGDATAYSVSLSTAHLWITNGTDDGYLTRNLGTSSVAHRSAPSPSWVQTGIWSPGLETHTTCSPNKKRQPCIITRNWYHSWSIQELRVGLTALFLTGTRKSSLSEDPTDVSKVRFLGYDGCAPKTMDGKTLPTLIWSSALQDGKS